MTDALGLAGVAAFSQFNDVAAAGAGRGERRKRLEVNGNPTRFNRCASVTLAQRLLYTYLHTYLCTPPEQRGNFGGR